MKFAVQHNLVPGKTLTERFERAAAFGYEAVEVTAWGFPDPMVQYAEEILTAMNASGLPVSTLCTMGSDDFVHPEPSERKKRLEGLIAYLELADLVGARGVVALPIRPPLRMPDLAPVHTERSLIESVAVAQLSQAIAATPDVRAGIFLEPLNRYEANYLRTIAQGAELASKVGSPRVKVLADVFHMNIEEADMDAAIRTHREQIGAVHLADSNRLLPGHGHIEFTSLFEALLEIGYDGFCALECGIPSDPEVTLPRCANHLKMSRESAALNLGLALDSNGTIVRGA